MLDTYLLIAFCVGIVVLFGRMHSAEGRAIRRLQDEVNETERIAKRRLN